MLQKFINALNSLPNFLEHLF